MTIDVVYTWVDGADAAWAERRHQEAARAGRIARGANHAARFESNDEIYHSVASVLRYAPWVRTIHIVTDGQRPARLARLSNRIRFVDHRDIFKDQSWLPCYSARGIESQLHRITDLAEHFVYFNDDMFLGKPVRPEHFFDVKGRPLVFTNTRRPRRRPWHGRPQAIPATLDVLHLASVERSRQAAAEQTGRLVAFDVRHQPKALSRRLMHELEARFQPLFDEAAKTRFRTADTINALYLHAFYGMATGQAVAHYVRSIKLHPNWKDALGSRMGWSDSCLINLKGPAFRARVERLLQVRPRFICLNQTADTTPADILEMRQLMQKLWAIPDQGANP